MNSYDDFSKIKVIFHSFNINSEIDSVYGNWVVSKDGDGVNYLYLNAILAIHLKDTDWLEKMKHKVWFKPECEDALRMALNRTNEVAFNHTAVKQHI